MAYSRHRGHDPCFMEANTRLSDFDDGACSTFWREFALAVNHPCLAFTYAMNHLSLLDP
jgi:hypothetical protein